MDNHFGLSFNQARELKEFQNCIEREKDIEALKRAFKTFALMSKQREAFLMRELLAGGLHR